ncbi:MAG: ubiquinol-cytochrome c reductase iron-sulfur subunit, partial [Acetobacteraceae bacterium]|nr:ubiquinol-cytochrome c reductase iron-sulfur subunit [Acetobacteraceae bacterium]
MQRDPENPERRVLIGGCVAAAAGLYYRPARAADDDDPARDEKPKKGDQLVYLGGDHDGEVIAPADLKAGGPSVLAWPYDPEKKVPRDGSRLNVVLLVRLKPEDIDEDNARYAADGIVAFAGTCTHQQCPVAEWLTERQIFQCPCHQSQFDPKHGAQVVGGPAPRPLPKLPVAVADGKLLIAGPFIGRVGGMQPGT